MTELERLEKLEGYRSEEALARVHVKGVPALLEAKSRNNLKEFWRLKARVGELECGLARNRHFPLSS